MAGLHIRGLSKSFRVFERSSQRLWARLSGSAAAGKSIQALQEIDIDVAPGRTLGIVGRNGSGKSTLLRILAGAMRQDRGTIESPPGLASLLELGGSFSREQSGRRNVQLAWTLRGMAASERARRLEELKEFSGLGEHLDLPVKYYSGGQFLRLAFSEAVLWEPDIVVLDEILAVGDAGFQARCLERIETLKARGSILVMATHELGNLRNRCEQALWLDAGRVRLAGGGGEVAQAYAASFR
jgi:lipopolysaccharide transport system ATP-binding protein